MSHQEICLISNSAPEPAKKEGEKYSCGQKRFKIGASIIAIIVRERRTHFKMVIVSYPYKKTATNIIIDIFVGHCAKEKRVVEVILINLTSWDFVCFLLHFFHQLLRMASEVQLPMTPILGFTENSNMTLESDLMWIFMSSRRSAKGKFQPPPPPPLHDRDTFFEEIYSSFHDHVLRSTRLVRLVHTVNNALGY